LQDLSAKGLYTSPHQQVNAQIHVIEQDKMNLGYNYRGESAPPTLPPRPGRRGDQSSSNTKMGGGGGGGGSSLNNSPMSVICYEILNTILPSFDPDLTTHLISTCGVNVMCLCPWIRKLFVNQLQPLDKLLMVWDVILQDLSEHETQYSSQPHSAFTKHLICAILHLLKPSLMNCGSASQVYQLMFSISQSSPQIGDIQQLIDFALCTSDPFHIATIYPNLDVVMMNNTSLGINIDTANKGLIVKSFTEPSSQAKASGRVKLGDVIFAVNGVRIERSLDPYGFSNYISSIPTNPIYLSFQRARRSSLMTLSNNYNSAPVNSFNNSIDASEIEEEETKVNTNINMFGGGGNRFTQQQQQSSTTTTTRSQSPPKLPSSRPPLLSTRSTSNIPTSNNQQPPNVTSKIQQLQSQFNSKPSPINNAQSKYAPNNNNNNNIPIGGGGGGRTPPPPPSKSRPQLPSHANSVPNNLGSSNIVNNNNSNNNNSSSIPNIQLQTTLQPISQTPLSNINSQSSTQQSPSGGGGTIGGFMKKISEKLGSEKVDEVYDGDDLENNVTPEDITAPDGFIPTGLYIFLKYFLYFMNLFG